MTKKSVKKTKPKKTTVKKIEIARELVDNSVADFDFSDNVEVTSYPRGMLFSFGKENPRELKTVVTKQILLPFEVAISLNRIITGQINSLVEQGLLSIDSKDVSDVEDEK